MPTCPDCGIEMKMGPDTFHALLVVEPPGRLFVQRFYPVSLFACPQCALLRLYSAELREREAWEAGRQIQP